MSAPRVGALFAGYGGLELAVHDVFGAEPAWFSEFDEAPSKILAHHWPDVPNLGDITKIDWATVEPVDIITGGSPCQDLSHAGKRAGMTSGTRSNLWVSMREAIAQLHPSLVVWENVRGAYSACADSDLGRCPRCLGTPGAREHAPVLRALGRVLGDLSSLGYDAAWHGLRAADLGAPHGRFRIFVLAWPAADADRLGHEWAGRARDRWTGPADGDQPAVTLLPTPVTQPSTGNGHARNLGAEVLLPTPVVNDMGAGKDPDAWDAWTASMQERHGNGNGHGPSLAVEVLRMLPTPRATDGTKGGPNQRGSSGDLMLPSAVLLPTPSVADATGGHASRSGDRSDELLLPGIVKTLLPTPTAMDSKASGGAVGSSDVTLTDATVRTTERGIDFGVYAPAIARWEAITRPAPSPTEPTGKGGAQRLSPRFVEWMQGLDDGWVTDVPGITRNDMLKALGNGVVPQQCAAALRWLLKVRATAEGRWAA